LTRLSTKSIAHKKRRTNRQQDNSTHNRHRDKPDETRNRTNTRTNRHRETNQPRSSQGKSSSSRTRHETAPNHRARERTRRGTHRPGTTTTRQSQTDNATETNTNTRRTKTNEERRTRHGQHRQKERKQHHPKSGGYRADIGQGGTNKKPRSEPPNSPDAACVTLGKRTGVWGKPPDNNCVATTKADAILELLCVPASSPILGKRSDVSPDGGGSGG
jgi:hypothetical protein